MFLKKYPSFIPMDTRSNKFAWIKDYDNDENLEDKGLYSKQTIWLILSLYGKAKSPNIELLKGLEGCFWKVNEK